MAGLSGEWGSFFSYSTIYIVNLVIYRSLYVTESTVRRPAHDVSVNDGMLRSGSRCQGSI